MLAVLTPGVAQASDGGSKCRAGDVYRALNNYGSSLARVGAGQSNYNGSNFDVTNTFSAKASGTISQSVSASTSLNGNVVVAGAEAKVGYDLSVALTAELGNTTQLRTPPKKTGNGDYGVYRIQTSGTYYKVTGQCTVTPYPTTAWSPWRVGWHTWNS
jgi:hypothetical protein